MKNKKILIVGGTGSFGSALAHKLLEMGVSQIRIFARNEAKMVEIKRTLTDKNMNRFFINIPKACELLIESAIRGAGGEIFIARMPSLWIYDIAKYLVYKYGLDESIIVVTGLRPGEKNNECLATQEETKHIYCVNDELYISETEDRHSWIKNGFIKKDNNFLYHSQDAVISYEQTVEFLKAADI